VRLGFSVFVSKEFHKCSSKKAGKGRPYMAEVERTNIKPSRRDGLLAALCLLGVFAVIVFVGVTIGGPPGSPLPKFSTEIGESRIGHILLQRFGETCHQLLFDNHTGRIVASGAPCVDQKIVDEDAERDDRFSTISKAFSNR